MCWRGGSLRYLLVAKNGYALSNVSAPHCLCPPKSSCRYDTPHISRDLALHGNYVYMFTNLCLTPQLFGSAVKEHPRCALLSYRHRHHKWMPLGLKRHRLRAKPRSSPSGRGSQMQMCTWPSAENDNEQIGPPTTQPCKHNRLLAQSPTSRQGSLASGISSAPRYYRGQAAGEWRTGASRRAGKRKRHPSHSNHIRRAGNVHSISKAQSANTRETFLEGPRRG